MIGILAALGVAGATGLTGLLTHVARKRMLFDRHNERSAHTEPTPRLGGLSIVIISLLGSASAVGLGLPVEQAIGLIGGGLIVAGVGAADDLRDLRASFRLIAHIAAAVWAVYWIGPLDLGFVPFWNPDWSGAAAMLTVLMIVWMINLYNFMDGINGLAASQAISIAVPAVVLPIAAGAGTTIMPSLIFRSCTRAPSSSRW